MSATAQRLEHGVSGGTIEVSYHRHAVGGYVDPAGWRALGAAWLRALVRWLQEEPGATPTVSGALAPDPGPLLDGWHIVHLPHNTTLTGSPRGLAMSPTEERNGAW